MSDQYDAARENALADAYMHHNGMAPAHLQPDPELAAAMAAPADEMDPAEAAAVDAYIRFHFPAANPG